jgi:ankyrin repeat protein
MNTQTKVEAFQSLLQTVIIPIDYSVKLPLPFYNDNDRDNDNDIVSACRNNNLQSFKTLLPQLRRHVDANQLLIIASSLGHEQIVALLLRNKFVIATGDDYSALIHACKNRHSNVVKLLLREIRRLHVNVCAELLVIASGYGMEDVIKVLLKSDNVDLPSEGNAAIINACRHGHLNIVKMLSEVFTDFSEGVSAVVLSSANGHANVVKYLLTRAFEFGIDSMDLYESPALKFACGTGHLQVVKYLRGLEKSSS